MQNMARRYRLSLTNERQQQVIVSVGSLLTCLLYCNRRHGHSDCYNEFITNRSCHELHNKISSSISNNYPRRYVCSVEAQSAC